MGTQSRHRNPRTPWLCGAAAILVLGMTSAATAKRPAACLKSCKEALRQCTREAKTTLRGSTKACPSNDRKPCRQVAKKVFSAAKRVCRTFRKQCKACCTSGGASCDSPPELPTFSGTFAQTDRKVLDTLPLPPGPGGRGFMLLELPDGTFSFDPQARSPVSAAAECATVMLACFDPPLRNFAGCFANVPTCTTESPWVGDDPMCCPAACGDRYQELRRAGRPTPVAFAAAIWEAPSCMPGLVGATPRAQP